MEGLTDELRDRVDAQYRRWIECQAAHFVLWGLPWPRALALAFTQANAGRELTGLPPLEPPP